MRATIVRPFARAAVSISLLLLLAGSAAAGGAMVTVDTPDAAMAALAPGADLIVQASRCGEAANLGIAAHATGFVDGKRRSISLKLAPTGRNGIYGLTRQWPSSGDWVISLTPKLPFAMTTIVRVRAVSSGIELAGSRRGGSVRIVSTRLVKPGVAEREIDSELKKGA